MREERLHEVKVRLVEDIESSSVLLFFVKNYTVRQEVSMSFVVVCFLLLFSDLWVLFVLIDVRRKVVLDD